MASLEDLLEAFYTTDLADILDDAEEESIPPLKKGRLKRVAALVLEGVVDFDTEIIAGGGVDRDLLANMCAKLGLDRAGTKDDLKRRLGAWYAERYGDKKPTSGSSAAPAIERVRSQQQPVARNLAAMPAAEREFLRVAPSEARASLLGAIGLGDVERVGRSIAGALMRGPTVVQVSAAEVESFQFDEGVARVGDIYVRHPIDTERYIRAEDATERLAREKLHATIEIAGLLGATRVELIQDESAGTSVNVGADIAVLGREIGFDVATSGQGRSASALVVTWPESRRSPGGIPPSKQPYLRAMPELGSLERMVNAGRTPDQVHYDVRVDFNESQEIAARIKKIPNIGSLSGKLGQQSFASTRWTLRIWFTPNAAPAVRPTVAPAATYAPSAASGPHLPDSSPPPPPHATPGPPCVTCHSALVWSAQYQRWFCHHCQQYAAT